MSTIQSLFIFVSIWAFVWIIVHFILYLIKCVQNESRAPYIANQMKQERQAYAAKQLIQNNAQAYLKLKHWTMYDEIDWYSFKKDNYRIVQLIDVLLFDGEKLLYKAATLEEICEYLEDNSI